MIDPRLLPDNFRKRMVPEQRKELGVVTDEEVERKNDVKAERDLHNDFINWLRLNNIFYDHQQMNKKPRNIPGTADFLIFKSGKGILIEMKVGTNKLSEDQITRRGEAYAADVPYKVCRDLASAIEFSKISLGL